MERGVKLPDEKGKNAQLRDSTNINNQECNRLHSRRARLWLNVTCGRSWNPNSNVTKKRNLIQEYKAFMKEDEEWKRRKETQKERI